MKQKKNSSLPKPRRARLLQVKISDLELAAISDQAANENLASLSDYIRKTCLDRAGFRSPTLQKP
jgi:hypothetical protein